MKLISECQRTIAACDFRFGRTFYINKMANDVSPFWERLAAEEGWANSGMAQHAVEAKSQ